MGFWDRFPLVSPSQTYRTPASKGYPTFGLYPTAQMPQPIPAHFTNEKRQTWYSLTQRSVYWVSSFLQTKGGRVFTGVVTSTVIQTDVGKEANAK